MFQRLPQCLLGLKKVDMLDVTLVREDGYTKWYEQFPGLQVD